MTYKLGLNFNLIRHNNDNHNNNYYYYYYLRFGRHPVTGVIFTYYIIHARTKKVDYLRVKVGRATCETCSGNLEVSGTIPAFALIQSETNKNLC